MGYSVFGAELLKSGYSRCLAGDLSQGISNKMFAEIVELLGGHHWR